MRIPYIEIYLVGFVFMFVGTYGGLTKGDDPIFENETICQRIVTIGISFLVGLCWFIVIPIMILARRK